MQRFHHVTVLQFKKTRLKKSKLRYLHMSNKEQAPRNILGAILLTSLLIITTSDAYSDDMDCDIIELDDFQETSESCVYIYKEGFSHGSGNITSPV